MFVTVFLASDFFLRTRLPASEFYAELKVVEKINLDIAAIKCNLKFFAIIQGREFSP